ncbi:MAG: LLM class flavin-dependent oxidoreductase [Pseudomonadota bacterium]
MQTRFGISTPSDLWQLNLPAKQARIQQIVELGFDHIFMADHVSFRNGSGTDGFIEVAGLSQLNDDIGVMISIYLLPLRHPLPVARQLATMAEIAPGRMIFGIGVGGEDRHEIEICGVDPSTRGKRTNESLAIIKALLAGETVDHNGDIFTIEAAKIRPTPASPTPIIVGGRSNAALARVGQYGDGWIGVWCSTKRYLEATRIIDETAAAAGRDAPNWIHGYQPWLGIAETRDQARRVVKEQMEAFYKIPFEQFERYTPFGTPEEVAEQLSEYAEVGSRLFNLKVCTAVRSEEVSAGGEVIACMRKHGL